LEEIHNQGGSAEFKAVNVADREESVHSLCQNKFGRVDVIFNAGVMPLSPMNALKVETP